MFNLTAIAFDLTRDSKDPLFVQLSDQIRQRISSGQIKPALRLPPSRGLALELGISRSTVVAAYEQLIAEGYIEGRAGSGLYVRELGEADYPVSQQREPLRRRRKSTTLEYAPLSHPGYPDNRLFPYRQWARTLARSARMNPDAMIVSKSPFGDRTLRQSIANYLADWRGLEILPEQIMLTAGSVDALETCIRTLCVPGETVGLENPGYRPLHNITDNQGMRIEWLKVGADGTEIPRGSKTGTSPRMVVLTPSQQFPLGGAMPVYRRLEYQQWAENANAWIVEDDYDSEFRYAGRPIPALASMDNAGRTLYIGTFSKVFSVSLRLGYLIIPLALVDRFAQTLSRFGVKAALPCQAALADFIDSGDFYRHIRRVRRIYADRRRLLLDLVQQELSQYIQLLDHQAGMQLTVKLSPEFDDQAICRQARNRGVLVAPLSSYYGGGNPENGLLLGFCPCDEQEITANIGVLSEIFLTGSQSSRD
ncbi:MAG: PLP-dependent aminotransferase family protein [Gammaproteobacteria bacterium]|nr:PLP-dependent aminotransferase family protein [Gammaproteobacteria bacterium]